MIIDKLHNFIKQFGLIQFIKRFFLKLISPVLSVKSDIVLCIINHKQKKNINEVKLISENKINLWLENRSISIEYFNNFNKLLGNNCIGYYIEINNELAAWGFVQTKGTYKYGSYFYDLPESVHMLKNLYVKPNYRGMSLGKKINEARINAIPEGCIPCVFVIPENKYAIRNLKLYGFQEQLKISHTSWFKKYTYTRLQLIHDTKLNKIIIKGFKTL